MVKIIDIDDMMSPLMASWERLQGVVVQGHMSALDKLFDALDEDGGGTVRLLPEARFGHGGCDGRAAGSHLVLFCGPHACTAAFTG